MLRFIAYAWDVTNSSHQGAARMLCQAAQHDSDLACVFEIPGLAVFACGFRARSTECYKLQNHGGVVLGTLFGQDSKPDPLGAGAMILDGARSARIVATEARDLINRYWGRYVAFIRDRVRSATWVLQDPSAGLSMYRATVRGVSVYFSEQADCTRLTGARFNVNWRYLGAHAYAPVFQSSCTALDGVSELMGGQCDQIAQGQVTTRSYWTPATFARCRIDDSREAELATRDAVMRSVHMWAGCYSNWLHELSGGVDSSITYGCLRKAPTRPNVKCHTYYWGGVGVDERKYAQIMIDFAGCDWIQTRLDADATFEPFRKIAPSPRPGLYLPALQERKLMSIARENGVTVISTGNGGDALFGQLKDSRIAGDYLRDHGLGGKFFDVIVSTAELTQTSVGQVLRRALASLWTRSQPLVPLDLCRKYARLLTCEAVDAAERTRNLYAHAWVDDAKGLPLAKIRHIAMMAQPMTVRTLLAQPGDPDHVHPLATQLVLEPCAAIPTYVMTRGGRTRATARAAFWEEVPAALLARLSKGNPSTFVADLIAANSTDVRDRLLGGQLVQHGVLEKRTVERALSDGASDVTRTELLTHVCMEYWLEAQRGSQTWAAAA